jgi:type II secretory pathway component PulF
MAEPDHRFRYVAIDPSGRRVRGQISARGDGEAFERLKRDGLSPIRIRAGSLSQAEAPRATGLGDREAAEFLADLAALLAAGSDMRSALGVLGARRGRPAIRDLARALTTDVGGGTALDEAFANRLGKRGALVAALVAAGDLAGGLQRAADMMQSRIRMRDQLVSVLSYPAFVFASTIVAVGVILLFVVPSLAPLVADGGGKAPLILGVLIAASDFLRANLPLLALVGGLLAAGGLIAARLGLLTGPVERLLLDGPVGRTVSSLTFGGFAIALGNMLGAGAPISDALRLAIRSVQSSAARGRLEPVAQAVRQGQSLSAALESVKPFPDSVVRLAAVGEATGALGPMLARAGKIEEDAAIRRIEAAGRLLGPLLIVALGGLIGMMMAGLLTGVSQLGETALQ